nr:hypothetical protein [Kibdelosporangium sp. MJ126-NF4]CEL19682.1 hypothetical protein [Kibdelosporangium sp. MJ126-NF4]CTQ94518.1 hypothetical protein [Kibdelosporangium sp. MJ126-NF4]
MTDTSRLISHKFDTVNGKSIYGAPHTDQQLDPHRLQAAAHELGHLRVWRAAGITVAYAKITGHGPDVSGRAHTGRQTLTTLDQARAYLVGLLAGEQAEIIWCDQNGTRYNDTAAVGDMERYHTFRRRYHATLPPSFTLTDLKRDAAAAVRKQWRAIERQIPTLARNGRIR